MPLSTSAAPGPARPAQSPCTFSAPSSRPSLLLPPSWCLPFPLTGTSVTATPPPRSAPHTPLSGAPRAPPFTFPSPTVLLKPGRGERWGHVRPGPRAPQHPLGASAPTAPRTSCGASRRTALRAGAPVPHRRVHGPWCLRLRPCEWHGYCRRPRVGGSCLTPLCAAS